MKYHAGHPDEIALHHSLRDALNAGLKNKDFFVWINVTPTGESQEFDDLQTLVSSADSWLDSINPDDIQEKELPKLRFDKRAATVEITALPRKPEVRGHRAAEIVGNPSPMLVGWNE